MARMFSDAHAHPADIAVPYSDYTDAVRVLGCSSRMSEWAGLRDLADARVTRFYGVHPWHAGEWSGEARAALRSYLENDPAAGVGEIGLDAKRGDPSVQIAAFREQMEIAAEMGRPVQIHDVGCEKQVLDMLRDIRPGIPVIMHSFSSESYAGPFLDLGCMLSVNPRILARSDRRVERLLDSIPGDALLLESDAPYSPRGFAGMSWFADRLSEATGTSPEHLLELSAMNAERTVGWRA